MAWILSIVPLAACVGLAGAMVWAVREILRLTAPNPARRMHPDDVHELNQTFARVERDALYNDRSSRDGTKFLFMDAGLAGKGIVVTGGGGGIGQAVVRAFAAEGARVAVHYRTSQQVAEQLASEVGGVAIGADLRVESEADSLIPRALEALGRVDVVVANAGVWPLADQPIWELSLERWRGTLDANLTATFLTARGFLRHAAAAGGGSLVMIASTAGVFGEAGHADYASAKGAILSGLLLSAKNEAARLGGKVRVNVVAPGWTVTPMTTEARRDPDLEARVTSTMALKKLGAPEDVAAQVVILASDRLSGHVTGQVVVVAGGMEGRLVP